MDRVHEPLCIAVCISIQPVPGFLALPWDLWAQLIFFLFLSLSYVVGNFNLLNQNSEGNSRNLMLRGGKLQELSPRTWMIRIWKKPLDTWVKSINISLQYNNLLPRLIIFSVYLYCAGMILKHLRKSFIPKRNIWCLLEKYFCQVLYHNILSCS